ncbi:MAG TPA: hypothetical protein VM327_02750 [Candidatus Thermoplasmatota archaeon]|nr:hypothetical protein [Candidatus Thermoplasmatota archaeon]
MVLLMYASHPVPWADPHGTHPFLDERITEATVMALIALTPMPATPGPRQVVADPHGQMALAAVNGMQRG